MLLVQIQTQSSLIWVPVMPRRAAQAAGGVQTATDLKWSCLLPPNLPSEQGIASLYLCSIYLTALAYIFRENVLFCNFGSAIWIVEHVLDDHRCLLISQCNLIPPLHHFDLGKRLLVCYVGASKRSLIGACSCFCNSLDISPSTH
jgi:hypothetical protein